MRVDVLITINSYVKHIRVRVGDTKLIHRFRPHPFLNLYSYKHYLLGSDAHKHQKTGRSVVKKALAPKLRLDMASVEANP